VSSRKYSVITFTVADSSASGMLVPSASDWSARVEVIPLAGDDDLVDLGRRLLLRGTLGIRRRLAGVAATKTSWWSWLSRTTSIGPRSAVATAGPVRLWELNASWSSCCVWVWVTL
jgi:hypothetical protein